MSPNPSMSREEVERFITGHPFIAALGTVKKDGSPHVDPVGYLYDSDQGCVFISLIESRWVVKRLRRDPRVFLSIFDDETPEATGVQIAGRAEFVADPNLETSLRILRRYTDFGDQQPQYERLWKGEGSNEFRRVLIRIRPERMFGWDHKKTPVDRALNGAEEAGEPG